LIQRLTGFPRVIASISNARAVLVSVLAVADVSLRTSFLALLGYFFKALSVAFKKVCLTRFYFDAWCFTL
jgi:hypothetical protein